MIFFVRNENLVHVVSVNGYGVVVSDDEGVQYNIGLNEERHTMEAYVG